MIRVARNKEGGIDWAFYASAWPIFLGVISAMLWIGGAVMFMLETPAQKTERTLKLIAPVEADVEQLKRQHNDHRLLDGHREMRERMKNAQMDIDDLQRDVRELQRKQ